MTLEYKLKSLILFHHIAFMFGLIFANLSWLWVSFIGFIIINRIGGEIGLHRYFAHRSFKTSKWKRYFLFYTASLCNVGSPLSWVGVHRKHHVKSDTEDDPHGNQSMFKVWSTFWDSYQIEPRYAIDLMKDPVHKIFHRYYFPIVIISYIWLGIIAWELPIFLISASCLITYHSAGLVNTICHKYGYKSFNTKDKSTNNTIVNIITLGSGLHNNHHYDPANYSNKFSKYEFDLPAWIIKNFFMKYDNTQIKT